MSYYFIYEESIMDIKLIIIWIEAFIIIALGTYMFFSEPKEKVVTQYKTEYKTVVKEKIVEKECKPKMKVVYKIPTKKLQKNTFLLATDSDMNNNFTISLISKTPIKDDDKKGETILLNGFLEELGYKSKFMLSANKKLIQNSYFRVINKKTKDTYTSPLCFENIGEGGLYDVKLNIIGGGVFCDVEELREDEVLVLDKEIDMPQLDDGDFMANGFIEDVGQIFQELNITLPDINKTKLKEILLKNIEVNEESSQSIQ